MLIVYSLARDSERVSNLNDFRIAETLINVYSHSCEKGEDSISILNAKKCKQIVSPFFNNQTYSKGE